MSTENAEQKALRDALAALRKMKEKIVRLEQRGREPLAIIGAGCRLPGKVDNLEAFLELLRSGRDAVTPMPPRWDMDALYDPDPARAGKMYACHGGFLQDVDRFDADFFGISRREAEAMDPQQRLLLEVTWQALEHAGIRAESLKNSRTGVYTGIVKCDYLGRQLESGDLRDIDAYCGTGTYHSVISGRISHFLGLQGPALSIDTACSSSLVTIHQACRALRARDCDLALAGGVNLNLTPNQFLLYCRLDALAPDGKCKTFDDSANGFVKSEGCGMVVLKRLEDAERDGDRILAVIRGSAVNHDGPASGLTVPNGPAQQAVLRLALADAGLEPHQIDFIETHGTGTSLGDPIEVGALAEVFGPGRPGNRPLYLGAVKSNLGHTETAAGVTGLLKAVLSLRERSIFANLHFEKLNSRIDTSLLQPTIPTALIGWRCEGPRRAGVSAFGISGTNAHIILEEAPPRAAWPDPQPVRAEAILLSARSAESLEALAREWRDWARSGMKSQSLSQVSRTTALQRDAHPHRLTVTATSSHTLAAALDDWLAGQNPAPVTSGRKKPGVQAKALFVFPGQGSQWVGMGQTLLESEPVFRASMEACEPLVLKYGGFSPIDEIRADEQHSRLEETLVVQTTLCCLQISLSALWASWGLVPAAVIGHSMGEVAAAHVAGALELEEAIRIICGRCQVVATLHQPGAMAVVELDRAQALDAIAGLEDRLSIAAVNGPQTVILSGEPAAMNQVLEGLAAQDVFCRPIKVDYASHSPAMDPLRGQLNDQLGAIRARAGQVPIYSTASGRILDGSQMNTAYWVANLREEVQFYPQVQQALADGCNMLVEISPNPVLCMALEATVARAGVEALVVPSLRRLEPDREMLLRTATALHCYGYKLDWQKICGPGPQHGELPFYPWLGERYWYESEFPPLSKQRDQALAISLEDLQGDAQLRATFETICDRNGFAARSVGQATGKPFVFLAAERDALFFFNLREHSIMALCYSGPADRFAALATAFKQHAQRFGLELNLLDETGEHQDQLARAGFSTTKVGVWHYHRDLAGFSLDGGQKRRLRYLYQKYEASGNCQTRAYTPGSEPETDRAIAALIDAWSAQKGTVGPLAAQIQAGVRAGKAYRHSRLWLVSCDQRLDGVLILSPLERKQGYLMDMEFYDPSITQGCMEYGIVNLIKQLGQDGCDYFSLGLTLGTGLETCPNEDPAVRQFFGEMQQQGLLDGDANARFKNKFRPQEQPAILARPQGLDTSNLTDLLLMLGDPTNETYRPNPPAGFFAQMQKSADNVPARAIGHPILQRELDTPLSQRIFQGLLSGPTREQLGQHKVMNRAFLPMTAWLDLALTSCQQAGRATALGSFTIGQGLTLEQDSELQIILDQDQLRIFARRSGQQESWTQHVNASLVDLPALPVLPSFEHLDEVQPQSFYARLDELGYNYGPLFQGISQIRMGKESIQTLIQPGSESGYTLAPALLDASLQCALWLALEHSDCFLLPLGLETFSLWRQPKGPIKASAVLHPGYSNTSLTLSVTLCDLEDRPFAHAGGLLFRKAGRAHLNQLAAATLDQHCYALAWEQSPLPPELKPDQILILSDRSGLGAELAACAEEQGIATDLILPDNPSEHEIRQLLGHYRQLGSCAIVDLTALDASGCNGAPVCGTALMLAHLTETLDPARSRIWLVTCGAQGAGTRKVSNPDQAQLWGFARVMQREMPDYLGAVVDLDPQSETRARSLLQTILHPGQERQLAFVRGQRLVPRIRQQSLLPGRTPALEAGCWLITGGLGGVGRELAAHLAGQGAGCLVLLGRSAPSEDCRKQLATLEKAGTRIVVARADVADEAAMTALFARFGQDLPPLRGIYHAAGLIRDAALPLMQAESFEQTAGPKVRGTLLLDRLSRDLKLESFVLFSSVASMLGTAGQASYAAANAFLDAFAHYRQSSGAPVQSINWGFWGEVGLAATMDAKAAAFTRRDGLLPFSTAWGMLALERISAAGPAQTGFFPLDLKILADSDLGTQPLWGRILDTRAQTTSPTAAPAAISPETLQAASPEERHQLLSDYLRQRIALVVKSAPERLRMDEHITSLGLDSLMIMELRNRIRSDLQIDVPAIRFFQTPSAGKLVDVLVERSLSLAPRPPQAQAPETALPVDVSQMSDAEVEAMLAQLMTGGD